MCECVCAHARECYIELIYVHYSLNENRWVSKEENKPSEEQPLPEFHKVIATFEPIFESG